MRGIWGLVGAALVSSVACCGHGLPGDNAPHDVPGPVFQQSYDAETTGNFEEALTALDALPGSLTASYPTLLRRAWLLYRLAKHAESIEAYRLASTREPFAVEPRLGLLSPLLAVQDWKQLELASQDVLERDPENYVATYRLGIALFHLERYGEAEAVLRRLLARYPADLDLRSQVGWTAFKMSDLASARLLFGEVLAIAPHHPSALEGWRSVSTEAAREHRSY